MWGNAMRREIYKVYAEIVDANGANNPLTGYPKKFDSRSYQNDCEKAEIRAKGELGAAYSAMSKNDERQLQVAWVVRLKTGDVIAGPLVIGTIPDDPGQVTPAT